MSLSTVAPPVEWQSNRQTGRISVFWLVQMVEKKTGTHSVGLHVFVVPLNQKLIHRLNNGIIIVRISTDSNHTIIFLCWRQRGVWVNRLLCTEQNEEHFPDEVISGKLAPRGSPSSSWLLSSQTHKLKREKHVKMLEYADDLALGAPRGLFLMTDVNPNAQCFFSSLSSVLLLCWIIQCKISQRL